MILELDKLEMLLILEKMERGLFLTNAFQLLYPPNPTQNPIANPIANPPPII